MKEIKFTNTEYFNTNCNDEKFINNFKEYFVFMPMPVFILTTRCSLGLKVSNFFLIF